MEYTVRPGIFRSNFYNKGGSAACIEEYVYTLVETNLEAVQVCFVDGLELSATQLPFSSFFAHPYIVEEWSLEQAKPCHSVGLHVFFKFFLISDNLVPSQLVGAAVASEGAVLATARAMMRNDDAL